MSEKSRVLQCAQLIMDYFGDEPFQAISCTGTDSQTKNKLENT